MINRIKRAGYGELQEIGVGISLSELDREEKSELYDLLDKRITELDSGGAMIEYTPLDGLGGGI